MHIRARWYLAACVAGLATLLYLYLPLLLGTIEDIQNRFYFDSLFDEEMAEIKSVVVVGASGNVGSVVLPELLKTSLKLSVLSRPESTATFPPDVNVIKSSYDFPSLTQALQGQDAVLCLLGTHGLKNEHLVVDAAAEAGVKFFIPSEFGHDTTDPRVTSLLPIFKGKTAVIDQLRGYESKGMQWVAIMTGLFFDWGLQRGSLFLDVKTKTATIWDGGDNRFCTTNLGTIGKAVAKLLTDPDVRAKALNRHVYITSFTTTQNEILRAAEKATGEKWTVKNVKGSDLIGDAKEKFARGDPSGIPIIIRGVALAEGSWADWSNKAAEGNALLLPDNHETVEETVKSVLVSQ